jgi:hypothetical protein
MGGVRVSRTWRQSIWGNFECISRPTFSPISEMMWIWRDVLNFVSNSGTFLGTKYGAPKDFDSSHTCTDFCKRWKAHRPVTYTANGDWCHPFDFLPARSWLLGACRKRVSTLCLTWLLEGAATSCQWQQNPEHAPRGCWLLTVYKALNPEHGHEYSTVVLVSLNQIHIPVQQAWIVR